MKTIINPVYRREKVVSARSMRMPLMIAAFNFILALFVLVNVFVSVEQTRATAGIHYGYFMTIFRYALVIEYLLVLFLMPSLTAGSISGERERRTLDLMLSSPMSPFSIIWGKLMSSMASMVIIIVSGAPVLALLFAYGNADALSMVKLAAGFFIAALFTGTIGICASSFCRRTSVATAITYGILLFILVGTLGLVILMDRVGGVTGHFHASLLFNPLVGFYDMLISITGGDGSAGVLSLLHDQGVGLTSGMWFFLSCLLQLLLSAGLLLLSVRNIKPGKGL